MNNNIIIITNKQYKVIYSCCNKINTEMIPYGKKCQSNTNQNKVTETCQHIPYTHPNKNPKYQYPQRESRMSLTAKSVMVNTAQLHLSSGVSLLCITCI